MKSLHTLLALAFTFSTAFATPPTWGDDVSKAISRATKENKMGFILAGRENCGNCQATKKMVNEGKIAVTAETFVAAEINIDDPRDYAEFERKFKKEKFGNTLPFVVITDSKGKALASYSGYKSADALTALIDEAKSKAAAKK
jgi:thioredoxin-related protein